MTERTFSRLATGLSMAAMIGTGAGVEAARLDYPPTRATAVEETLHGVTIRDPYQWLEDARAPEVQQWMATQHAFARKHLDALPGRQALVERLRTLLYYDSVSSPLHRSNRFFFSRRHGNQEKPILYWKEGENGEERILLDPNRLSTDGSVSLGVWVPSWNGKYLAYALRRNNADEATLYVMEVETGQNRERDTIPGARYATPRWNPTNDGFYYIYLPTDPSIPVDRRPGYSEARFHKLGTDPAGDPVLRERTNNPQTFQGISLSRDGRYLFSSIAHGWNATDYYFRDLKQGEQTWRPLVKGVPALFQVTAWKNRFYVLTNDGAPRYRVYQVNPSQPAREHW
ncbi:MAG: S9 family peptidase, partial [Armatimonadetes bacterium]|nr:S9 family peptidase [Armatimonadota bacterium]